MPQQPSSLNCFVCGVRNDAGLQIRFYETNSSPAEVTAEYSVPSEYQGYPGIVHGGIVASMLDEVSSRTVFRGDPPRIVVTARLSIRYRKPVPVNTPLKLRGWVVEDKGRVITAAGQIFGPNEVLLAEAEALLVEVDFGFLGDFSLDDQGWQVYPEN